MEKLQYSGMLRNYLKLPLYLIPVFIAGDILLFIYNHFLMGYVFTGCLALYTVAVVILYVVNKRSIDDSVINFAVGYAGVQK